MTAALTGCRAPEMRGRTSERVKGEVRGYEKNYFRRKGMQKYF